LIANLDKDKRGIHGVDEEGISVDGVARPPTEASA